MSLQTPISRAGARVELDYPVAGNFFGYAAGEAALARTALGWTPDLQAHVGVGFNF